MKFLSMIWLPAWALLFFDMSIHDPKADKLGVAGLAMICMVWLGVNVLITIVYLCTRAFRRASRDAAQP